jgi:glutathione synthase/RimK-type ligase-like ATP-grasp enzyme
MSLAVAIQMDPVESIDIDADSTFVIALEAQRRGHALFHARPATTPRWAPPSTSTWPVSTSC